MTLSHFAPGRLVFPQHPRGKDRSRLAEGYAEMVIAGITVEDHAVALLEPRLPDALARRVRIARLMHSNVLGLTPPHRDAFLAALKDDPPRGLEELRAALLELVRHERRH